MRYESRNGNQKFFSIDGIRSCNQYALAGLLGIDPKALRDWDEKIEKAVLGQGSKPFPKSLQRLVGENYKSRSYVGETKINEIEYKVKAVKAFTKYYAMEAGRYCTEAAKNTADSIMDLGVDVFLGHLAGDPILIGDAGLEAIAQIRTQLAIARQEAEAEHQLNLRLVDECNRLEQEAEQSSEFYMEAHLQSLGDREYSKYLETLLETELA